uniref:Uncharacterized protein n=1 Tax=Trypanosoma vivax (strain Y486) TaxID=1055687 RepID=G0U8D3_TRYVY|nr:conserved hypothetical protein [Trypanosoma vivax Y486]
MLNVLVEGQRVAEIADRIFDGIWTRTSGESYDLPHVHAGDINMAASSTGARVSHSDDRCTLPLTQQQQFTSQSCQTVSAVLSVNPTVEIAQRESVLQHLYNDRLRGSIGAILSAIVDELPRDHIFLQLLSDASTEQFCSLRIGEVVENFLFSLQAQQYYNVSSELARREVELLALTSRLEAMERQLRVSVPLQSFKCTQTEGIVRPLEGSSHFTQGAAYDEIDAVKSELLALLEVVTVEHELAKLRECLAVPMPLLETVQVEESYSNMHEYVLDIISCLFRTVRDFIVCAEASLDVVALQRGGSEDSPRDGTSVKDGGVCRKLFSQEPSPIRNRPSSPTATPGSQLRPQQRTLEALAEERGRLNALVAKLAHAQSHCVGVARSLSTSHADLQQQVDVLRQQLHQVEDNLQQLNLTADAKEKTLTELCEELERKIEMERASSEMHQERLVRQAAEIQQMHKSIAELQRQLETEKECRISAEKRAAEAEDAASRCQWEVNEASAHSINRLIGEQEELRAFLSMARMDAVANSAETVCARIECAVLDACVMKMDLLHRHGYAWEAEKGQHTALLTERTVRFLESQFDTVNATLQEREEMMQQSCDHLYKLLYRIRGWVDGLEAERATEADGAEVRGNSTAVVAVNNTVRHRTTGKRGVVPHTPILSPTPACVVHDEVVETGVGVGGSSKCRGDEPKTLPGVAAGLQNAFEMMRQHVIQAREALNTSQSRVREQQEELGAMHERVEVLSAECERQRLVAQQFWEERVHWSRHSPLNALLAKQKVILSEVDKQREALHKRWAALSEEYHRLERRNSELHERCTLKEVENARLLGFLKEKKMVPLRPSSSPYSNTSGSDNVVPSETGTSPWQQTTRTKKSSELPMCARVNNGIKLLQGYEGKALN